MAPTSSVIEEVRFACKIVKIQKLIWSISSDLMYLAAGIAIRLLSGEFNEPRAFFVNPGSLIASRFITYFRMGHKETLVSSGLAASCS